MWRGGYTIERPEDAESVLTRSTRHEGPAVVQAVVDPNEPPMPGKITTEQAIKFAEALARGQKDALEHHQDGRGRQNSRGRLSADVWSTGIVTQLYQVRPVQIIEIDGAPHPGRPLSTQPLALPLPPV